MKNLYLFVGPSGCGKTTVVQKLHQIYNWPVVESYTDRPRRNSDESGYVFLTKEEFDKIPEKLALGNYDGYRYCVTPELIENGGLYPIEPSGIPDVLEYIHSETAQNVYIIGFLVNETESARRMLDRGDSFDNVVKRIETDRTVFKDVKNFSKILIPDDMNSISQQPDINQIVDYIANFITPEEHPNFPPSSNSADKHRDFSVQTPVGNLRIRAKHPNGDCSDDYPGVYITLIDGSNEIAIATVEYDSLKNQLQTVVYADSKSDSPSDIIPYYK